MSITCPVGINEREKQWSSERGRKKQNHLQYKKYSVFWIHVNIFITIFIHHRKCGDSLIHEDAERGVERRISVNHCDVVKRPDVQLLQRLRQKRRFGDFRYLGEKMCRNSVFIERKLNILSCTRWVNRTFSRSCSIPVVPELHQQLCDRGLPNKWMPGLNFMRHRRAIIRQDLQRVSGIWGSSCVSGCRVCFPLEDQSRVICGSYASVEMKLHHKGWDREENIRHVTSLQLNHSNLPAPITTLTWHWAICSQEAWRNLASRPL